jgi:hypothetical protein
LSPLGKISAFPITRRALLQLFRVEYSNVSVLPTARFTAAVSFVHPKRWV